jgi:hypothetical protein
VRGRVEEIVGIGAADPAPGHSDQGRLEHELTASGDLTALIAENRRLLADVDRLRDLMRMYRIEPDGGSARSA